MMVRAGLEVVGERRFALHGDVFWFVQLPAPGDRLWMAVEEGKGNARMLVLYTEHTPVAFPVESYSQEPSAVIHARFLEQDEAFPFEVRPAGHSELWGGPSSLAQEGR